MVVTIASAVGEYATFGGQARSIIQLGGYWFVFWVKNSDSTIYYSSSPDGVTWATAAAASNRAVINNANFYDPIGAITDGTNIILAYTAGADGSASSTYIRYGTQSSGVISWTAEVDVFDSNGYAYISLCKTTNYFYITILCYTTVQIFEVFRASISSLGTWTNILALNSNDTAHAHPCQSIDFEMLNTDSILIIDQENGVIYSKAYNNTTATWDAFVSLNVSDSGTPKGITGTLQTYNNEIHYCYVAPQTSAINYLYYYYNGSVWVWSPPIVIESNTSAGNINLSANSSYLFLFYIISTSLYMRTLLYTTHTWSSSTVLVSSETSPFALSSPFYPTGTIGFIWTAGSSPYTCRFSSFAMNTLSGVTRDSSGAALGSCTVLLYLASNNTFLVSTTSNVSTGVYSFSVIPSTNYFVVVFLAGSPMVRGVSNNTLQGS